MITQTNGWQGFSKSDLNNDLASLAAKADIRRTIEDALWQAGIDPELVSDLVDNYISGELTGAQFAREIKVATGKLIKDIDAAIDASMPTAEKGPNGYEAPTEAVISEISRSFGIPENILISEVLDLGDTLNAAQVWGALKNLGLDKEIPFNEIQNLIDDIARSKRTIMAGSSLYDNINIYSNALTDSMMEWVDAVVSEYRGDTALFDTIVEWLSTNGFDNFELQNMDASDVKTMCVSLSSEIPELEGTDLELGRLASQVRRNYGA